MLAKVVRKIKCIFWPTKHDLDIRMSKAHAKQEELEKKIILKQELLNSSRRIKELENKSSQLDKDLKAVNNGTYTEPKSSATESEEKPDDGAPVGIRFRPLC